MSKSAETPAPRTVLTAEGLIKTYSGRAVVKGVSLEVAAGEIVGLLGPNGAGKTTTFSIVVGLVRPDAGVVRLGDRDLTDLPMYRRARAGICYLPQEPSVFRKMTVEENLLAILETLDLSRGERQERADRLLSDFGLEALRTHRAYTLSGGERRRVEIARSLVVSPDFLLLDEPFAGIDPIAVLEIQAIARRLASAGHRRSRHGPQRARDFVDRRPRLYNQRRRDPAGGHAPCSLERRRRQEDLSRGGFR